MTWPANMSPRRRYCARRFTWQPRFRNGLRLTQSLASSRACVRGRLARGKPGLRPTNANRGNRHRLCPSISHHNRNSARHCNRSSIRSHSSIRSSYCGTCAASQTNGNGGHSRSRKNRRTSCNHSSIRNRSSGRSNHSSTRNRRSAHSHNSTRSSDCSTCAASQTNGSDGRSRKNRNRTSCNRNSIRNRSSGLSNRNWAQPNTHSWERRNNNSTHSNRTAHYSRPNDGTPSHRRRSTSGRRRPARPPPIQYDVSWGGLLNRTKMDRHAYNFTLGDFSAAGLPALFAHWVQGRGSE